MAGTKTLIFVRHAHRVTRDRWLDNGLSEQGCRQADAVLRLARQRLKALEVRNLEIFSSPARRCRETVEAMAREQGTQVKLSAELFERERNESQTRFRRRIEKFLMKILRMRRSHVLICSHGDWLPEACEILGAAAVQLNKGAWLEIEVKNGTGELSFFIQKPDQFL